MNIGDIVNNKIRFLQSGEVLDFHEERDDYQKRELRQFLNMISRTEPPENDFDKAIDVLTIVQGKTEQTR